MRSGDFELRKFGIIFLMIGMLRFGKPESITTVFEVVFENQGSAENVVNFIHTKSEIECVRVSKYCPTVTIDGTVCACHDSLAKYLNRYNKTGSKILQKMELVEEPSTPTDNQHVLGSSVGSSFSDRTSSQNGSITGLELHCGTSFHSIKIRYGSTWAPHHGNDGGGCGQSTSVRSYIFPADEHVTSLKAYYDDYIHGLTIMTNKRTLPHCGSYGGFLTGESSGTKLLYISGYVDCDITGIVGHWGN